MVAIEPARLYGRVKRVTTRAVPGVEAPVTELTIEVKGSDGYSLDGLVGLLSDITIAPKQLQLGGGMR